MATRKHKKKWEEKVQASNDKIGSIIGEGVQKSWEQIQRSTPRQRRGSGALGPIPDWLPSEQQWELEDCISRLLGEYPTTEIRAMMKEEKIKREETGETISFDTQAQGDIRLLNGYDEAIRAGKKKGLIMLLGEETAKAITTRENQLKGGLQGTDTNKANTKEREDEIIQILHEFKSKASDGQSADQIITKVVKHFKDKFAGKDKPPRGYGKSTIRSIFNKHLKGK